MRKQIHRPSKEWEKLVKEFASFGGSKNEFCSQKGINYHIFKSWHDKLRRITEAPQSVNIRRPFKKLRIGGCFIFL
jgi:hypothetical protein